MEGIVIDSTFAMLVIPIAVIQIILVIVAVIDWVRTEETYGPKWLWLVLILFLTLIGPILYFTIGRRSQ